MDIGNNAFGDLRGNLRGSGLFFIHCDTRNMGEKMSDLVKRLRELAQAKHDDLSIGDEAAARIAELEAVLREIASGRYSNVVLPTHPPQDPAVVRARAALEGRRDDPAA